MVSRGHDQNTVGLAREQTIIEQHGRGIRSQCNLAAMAAISGLAPTMFMTRVRL
jgi:hypothetical protein